MLSGSFDHAIDDKGRVSLPGVFREALRREGHDSLFITNFVFQRERCLALYAPSEWEKLVAKLNERGTFDPSLQLFQIFFIGGAHEVQFDRQGRLLIPTKLREFASLERNVTFSALSNHVQLWDRVKLEQVRGMAVERLMDQDFMSKLNL